MSIDHVNNTCPVSELVANFSLVYGADVNNFSNTREIVNARNIPRFGHINDLTVTIEGDKAEIEDYVLGLVSASLGIFGFFCIWLILLMVFKCLGYRCVGFLSGQPITLPNEPQPPIRIMPQRDPTKQEEHDLDLFSVPMASGHPEDPHMQQQLEEEKVQEEIVMTKTQEQYEMELLIYTNMKTTRSRRVGFLRFFIVLAGAFIVVSAVFMIIFGVTGLNATFNNSKIGLTQAQDLANQANDIIDRFQTNQQILQNRTASFERSLDGFCPRIRDQLCDNIELGLNCNFDEIPVAGALETYLTDIKNVVSLNLASTQNDLNALDEQLGDLKSILNQYSWAFWVAVGFAVLLVIVTLYIIYGIVTVTMRELRGLGGTTVYSRFRKWCIGPIFILLVLLCWIFSMTFVIASMASADACYNSPDTIITDVIQSVNETYTNPSLGTVAVITFITFIVNGCKAEDVPPVLGDALTSVGIALDSAFALVDELNVNANIITETCGSDSSNFVTGANLLSQQLCIFGIVISDLADFFSCRNWRPLYESLAYNAACYEGNTGFAWIAGTQIVIVFGAMIILTLRSAFYQVGHDDILAKLPPVVTTPESPKAVDSPKSAADSPQKPDSMKQAEPAVDDDSPLF